MSLVLALLAAASAAPAACEVPPGWDAIAARKTSYVIFGELHGTEQSPAMFGAAACGLAAQGKRVLVALEIGSTQNDALQSAWALPHDRFAEALRRDVSDWTKLRVGGITSKAMFAMLLQLHAAKAGGAKIDVVAFNGARDDAQRARFASLPGQGPHEAAQAENIRTAANASRYDQVLVLVGNIHASKQPITRGGVTFEPMAMKLAPPDQVTSLDMAYAKGTAWNCGLRAGVTPTLGKAITSADIECAERPVNGTTTNTSPSRLAIGKPPGADDDGRYDGYFWVGAVKASAPEVDEP